MTHLWDSIFVKNLPEVPVFTPRGFPELKGGDEGVFVRKTLRENVPAGKEGNMVSVHDLTHNKVQSRLNRLQIKFVWNKNKLYQFYIILHSFVMMNFSCAT